MTCAPRRAGRVIGSAARVLALPLALTLLLAAGPDTPGLARPRPDDIPRYVTTDLNAVQAGGAVAALSSHGFQDTVSFGGTYWAADSLRWEALRDSHWTFDTGVGSSLNTGFNINKPTGYHQTMEGWFGIDQTFNPLPYFRRSSTCAISGSFSLWAGVTLAEGNALCYAGGQGYGNGWTLTVSKQFQYPGAGTVALSYKYAVEAEPGFDYAYVLVDTTGTGAAADIILWAYDDVVSGIGNALLNPGVRMRSSAGPFAIKFVAASDGGYADEDGAYNSTCGLAVFDDIQLSGAVTDFTDFESGSNNWEQRIPTTGIGDFSHLMDLADLPPPAVFCPCGLRDSVLIFSDQAGEHPLDQDNIAASPWIDLRRAGEAGRPGKLVVADLRAQLILVNYVFIQIRARYYPEVCQSTGLIYRTGWRDRNTTNPFENLSNYCSPPNAPFSRDYSAVIAPGAEQVQLGIGAINLCRTAPFGDPCSGVTNSTPWFDNLYLGVYGGSSTPVVNTTTFDRLQDNFAADGTLGPASPGRLDQNRLKGTAAPGPGAILGDTLNARGNGGNVEVRLVFKVRPGPFVNPIALAAYTARWTFDPVLNGRYGTDGSPATWPNWYSARMDTAQQAGIVTPAVWMSTFHEADPGFQGTDTTPDPNDVGRLANDILPDHLFTPGSRIDYFIASRYRPPDPRNPGGIHWWVDPDTSTYGFREAEILPSSLAADTTWNCVLYVDHHDDREGGDQLLEELGLRSALGPGGRNAEETRHDRWDVQTPSSAQLSFGRPAGSAIGASGAQMAAYRAVAWHAATLTSGMLTSEDAAVLGPWLAMPTTPGRRFWGTGEGLAQSMQASGGAARAFMNDQLGVLLNCTGIRLANCPSGTPIDTTYCLPLTSVAAPHFASTEIGRLRGNGCPDLKAYDLLSLNPAVPTARGQLDYQKSGAPRAHASITNDQPGGTLTRTVLDGFSVGRLRSNGGYYYSGCDDPAAALARTADVMSWFALTAICSPTTQVSAVPGSGGPGAGPGAVRMALSALRPNPATGPVVIDFVVGPVAARVRLDLFDVQGRLVRRLVDGERKAGVESVAWDGLDTAGQAAPPGLYFARLTGPDFSATQKLLVVR